MKKILNSFLLVLLPILGLYLLYTNIWVGKLPDGYLSQAEAFAHGHFYLDSLPFIDSVVYKDKVYWHEGPLPALIFTPFYLLKVVINPGIVRFLINILIFFVIVKLSRQVLKIKIFESFWFAFLYFFGSVFIAISFESISWYYGQVVATLFVLLSLLEYFSKRRLFVSGIFLSLAVASRIFSILGVLFFIISIWFSKKKKKEKIREIISFGLPIFLVLIVLGFYNFARFGSFFETGYNLNIPSTEIIDKSRAEGFFNIKNIPTNFYWYFLKGPDGVSFDAGNYNLSFPFYLPNPWGMSIFITMPFFFLAFFKKPKSAEGWGALLTMIVFLLFLLSYYMPGFRQYSARFINDPLPYWFILLLLSREGKVLSNIEKIFILGSGFINLYLFSFFKWLPDKRLWKFFEDKQAFPHGGGK